MTAMLWVSILVLHVVNIIDFMYDMLKSSVVVMPIHKS